MLMIGAIGNHLTTLVNLALHVADMPIHPIDSSRSNTFFDGLRSAVRLSGTEGKMLTLLFTVSTSLLAFMGCCGYSLDHGTSICCK